MLRIASVVLLWALTSTVAINLPAAALTPDDSGSAVTRSAPTAAVAGEAREVRIAAAGDIACQPPYTPTRTTCRQAATARLVRARGADAVLALGDTQYETGARADYRASYDPTWGTLKRRTYPAPGNHEYGTAGAAGYFGYFGDRAHGTRGYYAYDLGRWRMYALNSNCGLISCAAEVDWLRHDLRTNPNRCSLAYMHHPRFSSGPHGDSPEAAQLWPALERRQVDVVLAGHDHDYERFAPMTATGSVSADGIRSFVVGTGGKELYDFKSDHRGSQVRRNALPGVLFMTLRPRSYSWGYRTVDGRRRDSGTAACVT